MRRRQFQPAFLVNPIYVCESHFRLVRLADVERDETTARCCCRRLECTFKHSPSRAYGYAQNTRVSNKVADFLHRPLYYKWEIYTSSPRYPSPVAVQTFSVVCDEP